MYDVGGKLLNGTKSMYVNNIACIRIKGSESECFRIESGVRQGCIISTWPFNMYMDAMMKEVKMGMGRMRVRFLEEGREWRLPGFLYADDSVLYGESKEDMVMVGYFIGVRKISIKLNADKR